MEREGGRATAVQRVTKDSFGMVDLGLYGFQVDKDVH